MCAGRKPIFFFGHILAVKSITCNLLSSLPYFIRIDPKAYLLYASAMLSGMASGSGPTGMAMMVDLIPGDMREQVRVPRLPTVVRSSCICG